MKSFLAVSAVLICIGGCTIGSWGGANEKFERTEDLACDISDFTEFQTETVNGSIILKGADTDQVRVHAVITARAKTQEEAQQLAQDTKFEWQHLESTLNLAIQKPERPKNSSIGVALEITLPKKMALNLKSTNGRISISDVENSAVARTTNGSVHLKNISGSIQAKTTNGSIQCEQVTGDVNCITTNGKIVGSGLLGNLIANTTNGSAEIVYNPAAPAETSIIVKTTNGSIDITLPPQFAGTAQASTSNGKIYSECPLTVTGCISKNLTGTIGSGGTGKLELKTTNGSIRIR